MEKTMYGLQGKRAIVTGAGNGIGRSIATRLAKEGCSIGIFDIDAKAADETMRHIRAQGSHCHSVLGDVSSKSSVSAGMAELVSALGGVDILVNNAGICRIGKILDMTDQDWEQTFGINVDGVYHVTRSVVPLMVRQRSGAVINISSWMGKSGVHSYGAYCASKFAIIALTQALACEVGEDGVRVNAVAPGLILETRMREESEKDRAAQGLTLAADRVKLIPARRAGTPEDIAKTVAFLASNEASYITGETISVTGGSWND
jgi:NAD(P)-dependent dehydrogenase (short-subunit alcohol dehydrogenase family)